VDQGVEQADVSVILHYGWIMLAIAAIGAVGAVLRNIFASRTSQTIGRELRRDLYRKVQRSRFGQHRPPAAGLHHHPHHQRRDPDPEFHQRLHAHAGQGSDHLRRRVIVLIILQTPRQFPVIIAIIAVMLPC
jgi:ATP-binding cassette subfamily B protein